MTAPTIDRGGRRQIIDNAGQEVFGDVAANPEAFTVLGRLKSITEALGGGTGGDSGSEVTILHGEDPVSVENPLPVNVLTNPVTVAGEVNADAHLQVGDADVSTENPVPVSVITSPVPVAGTVAVEQSDATALKATLPPPTAFYHGQKAVASAGTAEALAGTQALQRGVLVKALSTNTGLMYVGDEDVDSTNGFELEAGDMTYIEIDDLAKVYVDAAEDGEGVSYVAS